LDRPSESIFINQKRFGKNGPADKKLIISDRREFAPRAGRR